MNREIKFRVFDGTGYMSSPFTLKDIQEGKVQFASECPVMQYTGLKDKNGKEIYEGDICQCEVDLENMGLLKFKGTMRWYEKDAQFTIQFSSNIDFENRKVIAVEVIGNIYENPELLKNHTP